MKRSSCYLSTIDPKAEELARRYGLGLEIAEYCTAYYMDEGFQACDRAVQNKLAGISRRILHAPFNELFPCAIDPKARELARCRYRQAIALAQSYGARKVVIHGGYTPMMYFACWYTEQSIVLWRDFVKEIPENITVCLENVLEEEPGMIRDIVRAVDDPRLRLCLDVGHVNAYSGISCRQWLEQLSEDISHFHIHNNDGSRDAHGALTEGSIPMEELLALVKERCPNATYTLELPDSTDSINWLVRKGFLEG